MKQKLPVPTAKEINEAYRLSCSSAVTAVQHAIRCGRMLSQKKAELDRGDFDSWIEKHCEFGRTTAYKYIQAAAKSSTAVNDSSNAAAAAAAFPSIRGLLGIESKPSKKQHPDTTARSVKGAVMNPPESAAQGSEAGNRNMPSGEESGAREAARSPVREEPSTPIAVAPEPEYDPAGYDPEDDDAFKANIENVLMADDKLAAMMGELKQLHRELQGLKSSRDHYQSQAGEAVRLVKARDREIERLKRDLDKARNENEALRERVAVMEAA